ncbi:hypothetical protein BKA67DRAFT_417350 [Truncatella angustata]|uniref:Uncharacterized protein n=1 Tax=Truncatella angustata TaxID=152316 RepID=A0A9P8RJ67_9PEZI|nr:uncharacterized protein BKA67DRAFT_417350 [Truncatella angustata]KAH6646829.1 hypothetical protein BKA67DRAFT_417350 [Truncatella angustata]
MHLQDLPLAESNMSDCHCQNYKTKDMNASSSMRSEDFSIFGGSSIRDNERNDTQIPPLGMSGPNQLANHFTASNTGYDNWLFGQEHNGGSHPYWKNNTEMDLDPLRPTATPSRAQKPSPMSFSMWPEQPPINSQNGLLVLCSRLDHLESAMAQTRLNVVNVELGIRSLGEELLQARRDREQNAIAIEKLKNGLEKFMSHVISRLEREEDTAGADEPEPVLIS